MTDYKEVAEDIEMEEIMDEVKEEVVETKEKFGKKITKGFKKVGKALKSDTAKSIYVSAASVIIFAFVGEGAKRFSVKAWDKIVDLRSNNAADVEDIEVVTEEGLE